jgi:hypothetical protein
MSMTDGCNISSTGIYAHFCCVFKKGSGLSHIENDFQGPLLDKERQAMLCVKAQMLAL